MTELNQNVNKSPKQYNYCLDFIKGLACIFVVFMHCEFPGKAGTFVQAISRFCVPIFFMVSGYFSYSEDDLLFVTGGGKRKIIHIGKIVVYAALFYLVWLLCKVALFGSQHISVTPYSIAAFLLFNLPIGISSHLWFLFALLYVYCFYYILCRFRITRLAYPLAICMFVVYFILAQGAWLVGLDVPNCVYRNWLIEGFPFFMSGMWIHEHKNRYSRINNRLLVIVLTVSSCLCLLERMFLGRDFGVNLCTLPQVLSLFVFAVNNPKSYSGMIQRLGKECSLLIYVLHMFVWNVITLVLKSIGLQENKFVIWTLPIVVLFVTILLSLSFNAISDKSKQLVKK